jgi:hypothetical protein
VKLLSHENIKFHILPDFKLSPKPFSPHLYVILMFQQQHLSDTQVTATVLHQIVSGEVGIHRPVCWTFASLNAISDQAKCRNEQCQD